MKKFKSLILVLALLILSGCAVEHNMKIPLNTSSQTLTGAYANLGSEISIFGFTRMAIWLNVDINSSLNLRVKVLYGLDSESAVYGAQILTPSSSDVKLESEYYEFNVDADGYYVFDVGLIGANYAQIQVMAGTAGSPAGAILAGYATLSAK